MRKSIPPIPLFRSHVTSASRSRLLATVESGWLGYGPECRALEKTFTARGGWALSTSSCTSALYLAARLVRARAGDQMAEMPEVIVPSVSFVASAMAFLQAGVRPVLAEVSPETLLLEIKGAQSALSPRTRALLIVHLYGQRSRELVELRRFADRHRLLLIEDCAHRVDLLDDMPPAGDLSCYSFNAVKELPCGEGGLIWGRDPDQEPAARAVSNLGLEVDTVQRTASLRHADYAFASEPGLKLRGNDVAASLVNAGFETLSAQRAQRREQFLRYDAVLAPLAPVVRPLRRFDDDSFLMYVVTLPAALRDEVRASMAAAGIATSVHYPSLTHHPLLGGASPGALCHDRDKCLLTLPTFLELTAEQQRSVIDALGTALATAQQAADRCAIDAKIG